MPTMQIADKSTLDNIANIVTRLNMYKGIRTKDADNNTAIMYYLKKNTIILCDKTYVKVLQKDGSIATINNGYQVTQDTLVYVMSKTSNLYNFAYSIL